MMSEIISTAENDLFWGIVKVEDLEGDILVPLAAQDKFIVDTIHWFVEDDLFANERLIQDYSTSMNEHLREKYGIQSEELCQRVYNHCENTMKDTSL